MLKKIINICFFVFLFFCVDVNSDIVNADIAFVGDSITTGSYPAVASDVISSFCCGGFDCLRTKVFAKRGASTRKVYSFFKSAVSERFKTVVVYAGINDCINVDRSLVSIKYLNKMALFSKNKINLVFVKIHIKNKCSAKINKWIDGNAAVLGYKVVDTSFVFGSQKGLLAGDKIHLSRRGNLVLGNLVADVVIKCL